MSTIGNSPCMNLGQRVTRATGPCKTCCYFICCWFLCSFFLAYLFISLAQMFLLLVLSRFVFVRFILFLLWLYLQLYATLNNSDFVLNSSPQDWSAIYDLLWYNVSYCFVYIYTAWPKTSKEFKLASS